MDYLSFLLPTIQHFGVLGYWLVLLISLAESLAFVGTLVPGAILIILAGFLSAQGYLDLGDLIWFAASGAILGDGVSYYLGKKGTRLFRYENKILKLSHLEKGEQFFKKYGNKSIFLGRFIGPLRPIVPFVAGLSKMNQWPFLLWNVVSAFLWAASHLLLGYFFGGAAKVIEVWSTRLGFFLLALALCFILIWLAIKKSRPLIDFLASLLRSLWDAVITNRDVQSFIKAHPLFWEFLKKRFDRKRFSGLPLTLLFLVFVYTLALFIGAIGDIINSEQIVAADYRLANLLYAFRDAELIKIFLVITLLAKAQIVVSAALAVSIICWLAKRRDYLIPLWSTIAGAGFFSLLGKLVLHRPRPAIAYYIESGFSFPSGHATLAVAFYGFVAYILFREITKWRNKINVVASAVLLVLAIGLSRLYLGVHYLSDVWGGYLLGLLWLIIGISLSERLIRNRSEFRLAPARRPGKTKLAIAALILAELAFFIIYARHYRPHLNFSATPVTKIVSGDLVTALENAKVSSYTETLIGDNQEPLTFIIVAPDDQKFIASLRQAGWSLADEANFSSVTELAKAAILKTSYPSAPMTPSFWNSRVHDFGFEKPTPAQNVRERHHARFWRTQLVTLEGDHIYVGTASLDAGIKWFIVHRIKPDIDTERDLLFTDLAQAGLILSYQKEQFVEPILGQNFSGDQFFTDGKLYSIVTK